MSLREISLRLPNRAGTLASVARILAHHHINVAAISVDSTPRVGSVRLVLNDPDRAIPLLKAAGYPIEVHELIAVHLEDRSGTFLKILEVLAQGQVNIRGVVILIAREGNRSLVGLHTDDLAKARELLDRSGFLSPTAERLVSNADLLATAPTIPSESVGMLL
jgi:hypothetical protein